MKQGDVVLVRFPHPSGKPVTIAATEFRWLLESRIGTPVGTFLSAIAAEQVAAPDRGGIKAFRELRLSRRRRC